MVVVDDLPIGPLLKNAGDSFSDKELAQAEEALRQLDNENRIKYRDFNARELANHLAPAMLVVAGPGAGKSYMFMDRVRAWLREEAGATIRVASFVRKLVYDLQADVKTLKPEEASRVRVSTLHSLARSYVERNQGTSTLRLEPYVRIITREWEDLVWLDTLSIRDLGSLSLEQFKSFFHDDADPEEEPWQSALEDYSRIRQFYNAIGFGDSILLATEAVTENPDLVDAKYWVFDEFQDFNKAEEKLILAVTSEGSGLLLAGDDDQAIYQDLKASHPEIIRSYYRDKSYAKGLLPYCSRCGYHIALAGEAFFKQHQLPESIKKVFLPLQENEEEEAVQIVGCAHPSTAVTQVEQFIEDHREELETRREELKRGDAKDPFLLVLTYPTDLGFLSPKPEARLVSVAEEWRLADRSVGRDFLRVLVYRHCAKWSKDNFALRKVLFLEGVPDEEVRQVIRECLNTGQALSEQSPDLVEGPLGVCKAVQETLEDPGKDPREKADDLSELIAIEDQDQLAVDIAAHVSPEGEVTLDEEDEEVWSFGRASPVEVLTMSRAKGLSADHVIVLGCDQVNMGHVSPQVFFVAMTRARKSLSLIISLKTKGAAEPHPYLADLPSKNCRYVVAKQGGTEVKESFEELSGWLEFMHGLFSKKR